ncbi:MAG TPA: tetratricopeptide repeat protein [Candidatus Acidoferrales bacterium]|jgi:tetratricopeptide (TPR) repeat protein|nr:tetratricopeptide repeat protein [Candidatus Acidoferrales bacterium]
MEISLEGAGRKTTVLIAGVAVFAILAIQASELWLGDYRIHSNNIDQMERGAALLPGDAQAWDLLGHYYQWDFTHSDVPRALEDYRHAVRDNPLDADYWIDVASASEATGDDADARQAFTRAQAAYPASAEVDFYYGNFLLRQQEYPAAYAQLRRAAVADPKLLPVVISRVWRANEDVNQMLDQVLPANVDAYVDALDFFCAGHRADEALMVWERMRQLGKPIQLDEAFPLMDELIHEDRAEEATRAWREALMAAGLPNEGPTGGSLIWNGNFKQEFAEGGLGWRWDSPGDTSIDFDSQAGPNGSRAVRLDFTGGANIAIDAPYEYVAVAPNQRYHFHASMRTEDITTESGMRFAIADPNHADAVNVVTDGVTGTTPWTPVEADVSTGSDTHFLVVRLARYPSRLFDNKLGGTVWIADLSLAPSSGAAPNPASDSPTGNGGAAGEPPTP